MKNSAYISKKKAIKSREMHRNYAIEKSSIYYGLNLELDSDYLIFIERVKERCKVKRITALELKAKLADIDIEETPVELEYIFSSPSARKKLFICEDMSYQYGIVIEVFKDGSYMVYHIGYSNIIHGNIENWFDNILDEIHVSIYRSVFENYAEEIEYDLDL